MVLSSNVDGDEEGQAAAGSEGESKLANVLELVVVLAAAALWESADVTVAAGCGRTCAGGYSVSQDDERQCPETAVLSQRENCSANAASAPHSVVDLGALE
ncbi:hypothetical protein Efla_007720 [Eimeria flavescens]